MCSRINRRMRIELVYGSLPDTALARALSDIFLVRETQRAEQQMLDLFEAAVDRQ